MMKELYSREDIKSLNKRIQIYAAICIALVVIAVGVGVATCFFVTDDNANMLKITDIVLSSVCGCVALYFLFNVIIPSRARKNYIEKMLNSTSKTVRGRVIGKGKKITAVKHVNLSELRLTDVNGKELILYWDSDNEQPDFAGHIVEFKVVNNKIVGFGDAL